MANGIDNLCTTFNPINDVATKLPAEGMVQPKHCSTINGCHSRLCAANGFISADLLNLLCTCKVSAVFRLVIWVVSRPCHKHSLTLSGNLLTNITNRTTQGLHTMHIQRRMTDLPRAMNPNLRSLRRKFADRINEGSLPAPCAVLCIEAPLRKSL